MMIGHNSHKRCIADILFQPFTKIESVNEDGVVALAIAVS